MSDISPAIETNGQGPKQVTVDGVTVEYHSLPDQIAADKHLDERAARNKRKLPIRFAQIRPGGATP